MLRAARGHAAGGNDVTRRALVDLSSGHQLTRRAKERGLATPGQGLAAGGGPPGPLPAHPDGGECPELGGGEEEAGGRAGPAKAGAPILLGSPSSLCPCCKEAFPP